MSVIRIHRRADSCHVLGPGNRAVLWVQGCGTACSSCIVPESWDVEGEVCEVGDLAEWLLSLPDIVGLTVSGGEPMDQAGPLCELVDAVRRDRALSLMVYTGYRHEWLLKGQEPDRLNLLERIDLLVDGPYVERLHGDLLWRGSSNQRLIALSPVHQDVISLLAEHPHLDKTAGMEFRLSSDNLLEYNGVPPMPRFRERFEHLVHREGINLESENLNS